jgi:hypothetical protein
MQLIIVMEEIASPRPLPHPVSATNYGTDGTGKSSALVRLRGIPILQKEGKHNDGFLKLLSPTILKHTRNISPQCLRR